MKRWQHGDVGDHDSPVAVAEKAAESTDQAAAAASQGATDAGARTAGCPASAVAVRGGAAKGRDGKIPGGDKPSLAQGEVPRQV